MKGVVGQNRSQIRVVLMGSERLVLWISRRSFNISISKMANAIGAEPRTITRSTHRRLCATIFHMTSLDQAQQVHMAISSPVDKKKAQTSHDHPWTGYNSYMAIVESDGMKILSGNLRAGHNSHVTIFEPFQNHERGKSTCV